MKYLLDTHVVDWSARRDPRLRQDIAELLAHAAEGDLAISDVTLSELARHLAARTIQTDFSPAEWLQRALKQVQILPVTPGIALQAAFLEWTIDGRPHRDPADRHIVATAIEHRLPLLTCDRKIHALAPLARFKAVW